MLSCVRRAREFIYFLGTRLRAQKDYNLIKCNLLLEITRRGPRARYLRGSSDIFIKLSRFAGKIEGFFRHFGRSSDNS